MKEFRMGHNTVAHYSSLEELGKAWGCRPISMKTKDEKKLESQKEKFMNKHKCKSCGSPMSWIGGNMMTCVNDKCKGIKIEKEDKEGNKIISYVTSYDLLDELGSNIASVLFS